MSRPSQQVIAFLKEVLGKGPLPSKQVWVLVSQAGYSQRTYRRARKKLKIQAKRKGWGDKGTWELSLPAARRSPFNQQAYFKQALNVGWPEKDADQDSPVQIKAS